MKNLYLLSVKAFLVLMFAMVCFSVNAEGVDADAAKKFAKDNGCLRCHGTDKDKDGPAFNKTAAKLKADPKAKEKLLHHLTSGEKAKFPDGHEEPHKKLDDSKELGNLIDWILSL